MTRAKKAFVTVAIAIAFAAAAGASSPALADDHAPVATPQDIHATGVPE